jgi:hypothetical protein
MLSIPLPFVASLLFFLLAMLQVLLRDRRETPEFIFLLLCSVSTAIVGLRWTYDLSVLRILQPLLATVIPFSAWYCFQHAYYAAPIRLLHLLPILLVVAGIYVSPLWPVLLDLTLISLYIGYGLALVRASLPGSLEPTQLRFEVIARARISQRIRIKNQVGPYQPIDCSGYFSQATPLSMLRGPFSTTKWAL